MLQDPDSYKSNWEWCKTNSNYHFNNIIVDDGTGMFFPLGKFKGNWQHEVDTVVQKSKPINWETRKYYGDSDQISPMLAQEEYDLIQAGADPKAMMLTNMSDELSEYPVLKSIADYFQVTEAKKRIHVQFTGQMFNLHIDKLYERCPDNPDKVIRIVIMLNDWQPGQFYMYGNWIYERWRAGDAHYFDWKNTPHATANASNTPRATIQITGLKSEFTEQCIKNPSIYQV